MEGAILEGLRDPAGLPFYPQVFLALSVLTFALHIFAVQLMLGASGLTIWGAASTNPHMRRLGLSMLNVAKISVSVAIVLGVAPLLFVQVIYDPFWYTANVLSARYVIGFIVVLIAAYLAMYFYYFRNYHAAPETPRKSAWSMVASILLMLAVGSVMHVLSREMLFPEEWKAWYAPGGQIDPSGANYRAFSPFRFGFFIAMAVPVAGAWLVAFRSYFATRGDVGEDYLDFVGGLGRRMAGIGTALALVLGAGWMLNLPGKVSGFAGSPFVWVAALGLLAAGLFASVGRGRGNTWALMAPAVFVVSSLLTAIGREALRFAILKGQHGYDIATYRVNLDVYSTALFFGTFAIVGGLALSFLLGVLWNAGRSQGVYTPGPVLSRLGTAAIWSIGLWVIQFFAFGFTVWAQ